MNEQVIRALNKLNQTFYSNISQSFDQTRQSKWDGWLKLVSLIKESDGVSSTVFDIGCGNGRFLQFLQTEGLTPQQYVGIDTDAGLLQKARERFPGYTFNKLDLITALLKNQPFADSNIYDVVTIFGVMHHIPAKTLRVQLLAQALQLLKPGSLLAVSFWQYHKDPRFTKKTIEPTSLLNHLIANAGSELEPNDYLITWQNNSQFVRYVHVFDDAEIDEYITVVSPQAEVVADYYADGKSDDLNRYVVWKSKVL